MFHILGYLLAGYGIILVLMFLFQEKMMFFPSGAPFGQCGIMKQKGATAQHAGAVRYYFFEHDAPERWVIIFHGNAGSACDRSYFMDLFKDMNAHILVFEYPGYGGGPQKPGEKSFLKGAHGLVRHIETKNRAGLPIYLVGESIGTGVATWLAAQADIRTHVRGLILISPYTSLADVAQKHYFWLPVKLLMRHPFRADTWAGKTDIPAVLFHGRKDDIIPIEFARSQVKNFKGNARLVEIDHCGHNDIIDQGWDLIQKEVKQLIGG